MKRNSGFDALISNGYNQAMTNTQALEASCHCGAVTVRIAMRPDYINECNCSLCSSHGVWWGYFPPTEVKVTGDTKVYRRVDRDEPAVEIHFCGTCGCTTHWTLLPAFHEKVGEDRMGVNMRLFDNDVLTGIELRFPDGKGWDGIGQWKFFREAVTL
jgi:hypothetical protein